MNLDQVTARRSLASQLGDFVVGRARAFEGVGLVVALLAILGLALATGGSQAFATPIEWVGDLAPAVTGDDVVASAFNWVAAFAVLVLAGMAMRWAPKIVRSMRGMS
jgi:hypothetical protein